LDLRNGFADIDNLGYSSALVNTTSYRDGIPIYSYGSSLRDFSLRNSIIDFGYLRNADVVYLYLWGSDASVNMTDNVFVGAYTRSIINVVDSDSVSMERNAFTSGGCGVNCLDLNSPELFIRSNTMREVSVQEPYSLFHVNSANPSLTGNRFEDCFGFAVLGIASAPADPGFFQNSVVGNVSAIEFLVQTTTAFDDLASGFYLVSAGSEAFA